MKAYQCSKCECLYVYGDNVSCTACIDPRPNHREKNGAEECKKNFKQLDEKQWHERFSWE